MKILAKTDWKRAATLLFSFILIVILLRFFIFSITPFFLAAVLAALIDRPVSLMAHRIPRSIAVLIMLTVVMALLLLVAFFISTSLIYELISLSRYLPRYRQQVTEFIEEFLERQQDFFERVPMTVANMLEQNLNLIYRRGEQILYGTIERILNLTLNIPAFIIFILFTLIATFFLSRDRQRIVGYLSQQLNINDDQQTDMLANLLSYLRIQIIIMTITTLLTGTTFTLLGIPYAILLALVCGVLDIIPVLGPGAILWPMIIINLFLNIPYAVVFIILYLAVLSQRPILESNVLGSNIGVHPILLLLGMYIGLITMGFQGVILAPVSIIIFKTALTAGLIV